MNAWRNAAATMLCWVLPTYDSALRIQCTRQRCQVAPNTRRIAAFSPSCASEITNFTPCQAAAHQSPEEARPKRFCLGGTDVQPDDLAVAFGVDGHSDYRRHGD